MKILKRFLLILLITWVVVFCISLFTGNFENASEWFLSTFGFSVIISFAIFYAIIAGDSKETTTRKRTASTSGTTSRNKTASTPETIYVCQPYGNTVYYEIKGNKIYKHLSSRVEYEIKSDKVYRALASMPLYEIKGNLIYEIGKRLPKYRVEKDKLYDGASGRVPIYSLRNRK